MKLFGWGKSKVPAPQTVLQQVKKTDPRNSSHGLDRMGYTMPGCKSAVGNDRKQQQQQQQQGLFGVNDDCGYALRCKENGCDGSKQLQDTIRFVFSHEQEGLLAIGTFALEQLAAIRDTIDNNRKNSPDGSFESFTEMMQSSDDEAHLPCILKTGLSSCTRHELPVYGSDSESKALALTYKGGNRSPVAGAKPIVLLTALPPQLRRSLDPASPWLPSKPYVPLGHWTDSVPPPVTVLPETNNVDQELYYSSYFCGLFKKAPSQTNYAKLIVSTTRKDLTVHIHAQDDYKTKKPTLGFGAGNGVVPSLGKLAKLWRSNCKQARIAPERFSRSEFQGVPSNGAKSGEVLTTPITQPLENRMMMRPPGRLPSDECSPKVAEFRRRVAMHGRTMMVNAQEELRDGVESSNRSDGGHWIKTDSDYVVLEM